MINAAKAILERPSMDALDLHVWKILYVSRQKYPFYIWHKTASYVFSSLN